MIYISEKINMKSLLLTISLIASLAAFGQTTTDEDLQNIWKTNVQPIIDLDVEAIMATTQFPLQGDWYEEIDPEAFDGTKEMFTENLESIFSEEVRNYLSEQDYNSLSVMGDEDWTAVTLLVVLSVDEEGWTDESIGMEFEWVEDRWLLVSMSYYG